MAVNEQNQAFIAFIERDNPGLTVIDSWDGFGQRTTASGGVALNAVKVPLSAVIPAHKAFDEPTADGPISQIIQAAVDTGIAVGALEETKRYARESRPWIDSGQDHGWQDPFSIAAIGDLEWRVHGTEAILNKAGQAIDAALLNANEDTVADASVVVARPKSCPPKSPCSPAADSSNWPVPVRCLAKARHALAPVLLRGPAAIGHPWPCAANRHPCRVSPVRRTCAQLLEGATTATAPRGGLPADPGIKRARFADLIVHII